MGWIDLTQNRNKWRAHVSAVITMRGISWRATELLDTHGLSSMNFICYKRALPSVLNACTKLHSIAFQKYIISIANEVKPQHTILVPQHTFRHRLSFQHFISNPHSLFGSKLRKNQPTLRQGANVLIFDGKVWCLSKRGSKGFPLVKQSRQMNSKFMDILTIARCSNTTKHDCQNQKSIVHVINMYEQDWYSIRHNQKAPNSSILVEHRKYSAQ